MAKLRGSTNIKLEAIISTLELILTFEDIEMVKEGIKGLISGIKKV